MTDNAPALIGGAESAPTPLDAMKSTKQFGRLRS